MLRFRTIWNRACFNFISLRGNGEGGSWLIWFGWYLSLAWFCWPVFSNPESFNQGPWFGERPSICYQCVRGVCGKMKIELLPGDSKKNATDNKKKSYRCQNSILVDSAVDSKLFWHFTPVQHVAFCAIICYVALIIPIGMVGVSA